MHFWRSEVNCPSACVISIEVNYYFFTKKFVLPTFVKKKSPIKYNDNQTDLSLIFYIPSIKSYSTASTWRRFWVSQETVPVEHKRWQFLPGWESLKYSLGKNVYLLSEGKSHSQHRKSSRIVATSWWIDHQHNKWIGRVLYWRTSHQQYHRTDMVQS